LLAIRNECRLASSGSFKLASEGTPRRKEKQGKARKRRSAVTRRVIFFVKKGASEEGNVLEFPTLRRLNSAGREEVQKKGRAGLKPARGEKLHARGREKEEPSF